MWGSRAGEHKGEGFIAAVSSEAFNTQWCLAAQTDFLCVCVCVYWSNDNKRKSGNLGVGKSGKAMFSLRFTEERKTM